MIINNENQSGKTLLVDLGFTILGGPAQSPPAFLSELLGLPPSGKGFLADFLFCRRHDSARELLAGLGRELGRPLSAGQTEALTAYWNRQPEECRPLPGAADFCHQIVAAGYRFHIVSNLWRPFHLALSRHLPEFERAARSLLLSYQLGARKPGRAFYDQVFARLGGSPESMIMIGDSWEKDMAPCLERGLAAVLLASGRCRNVDEIVAQRAPEYPPGRLWAAQNYDDCLKILGDFWAGDLR